MNMNLPLLEIKNVKLSYFYDDERLKSDSSSSASSSTLWNPPEPGVTYIGKCVITIYKSSKLNLINATGLKSLAEIDEIKSYLEEKFNLTIVHVKIDNMFLSRKCFENFDVEKLIRTCEKLIKDSHHIIYDVLLSRGIYLIPRQKPKPSLILFRTGSVTVMSIRSLEEVNECNNFLSKIYIVENLRNSHKNEK